MLSSPNVDKYVLMQGLMDLDKKLKQTCSHDIWKVSRKEFAWLVVCMVFVDALSVNTMRFSYDLL